MATVTQTYIIPRTQQTLTSQLAFVNAIGPQINCDEVAMFGLNAPTGVASVITGPPVRIQLVVTMTSNPGFAAGYTTSAAQLSAVANLWTARIQALLKQAGVTVTTVIT
jgi:hypothetical protein